MTTYLTEDCRRTIFADLVAAQDVGANVPDSRFIVAKNHGVEVDDVRRVELEGLNHEWPPL